MKLKQEFFVREIDGKPVLIPSDPAVRSRINRLELNEAGSFLFQRIPNVDSEESLVNAVLDEYDVDRETAAQDVKEFLARLREYDII